MAYTGYKAITARNPVDLTNFVTEAIGDGWQPYGPPTNDDAGLFVLIVVQGTANGGGGGPTDVSADDITDATTVGKAVLTAADAAAARTAIGAGTSILTVGTGAAQAKAGDYTPPDAAAATKGLVLRGVAVADAVDETDVVAQLNALLASLRASGSIAT
jgi:hypothetical protein